MAMWNEKSFIYSPVIVELIIVDFNRWCNRVETDYENLLAKFLDCSHFFFYLSHPSFEDVHLWLCNNNHRMMKR